MSELVDLAQKRSERDGYLVCAECPSERFTVAFVMVGLDGDVEGYGGDVVCHDCGAVAIAAPPVTVPEPEGGDEG